MNGGNWFARYMLWAVSLRSRGETWDVTVFRWLPDAPLASRRQLDLMEGFDTRDAAITWAAQVMHANGARVMVLDAPNITLKTVLQFKPAPEACRA